MQTECCATMLSRHISRWLAGLSTQRMQVDNVLPFGAIFPSKLIAPPSILTRPAIAKQSLIGSSLRPALVGLLLRISCPPIWLRSAS
jgi:hypothetical protein